MIEEMLFILLRGVLYASMGLYLGWLVWGRELITVTAQRDAALNYLRRLSKRLEDGELMTQPGRLPNDADAWHVDERNPANARVEL